MRLRDIMSEAVETVSPDASVTEARDRMRSGSGFTGFDAAKSTYVDLIEAGIVDATKVVRVALENAVSVAGVVLLTEATLTEIPEEKPGRFGEPAPMQA